MTIPYDKLKNAIQPFDDIWCCILGDLSRSGLLAAIRDGVALRQVPQEVKDRPAEPGKVKVVDVQSELREKFMKRRKEQVYLTVLIMETAI